MEVQLKLPASNSDSDIASFRNNPDISHTIGDFTTTSASLLGYESHTLGRIQCDYTTTGYVEGHPFRTYI